MTDESDPQSLCASPEGMGKDPLSRLFSHGSTPIHGYIYFIKCLSQSQGHIPPWGIRECELLISKSKKKVMLRNLFSISHA